MSDEQQQAAIGRTVEEYVASKKKLAALQTDAGRISALLSQIAQNLASVAQPLHSAAQFIGNLSQQIATFPTGNMVLSVAQDIKTEQERKSALQLQLKNLGFEPRD